MCVSNPTCAHNSFSAAASSLARILERLPSHTSSSGFIFRPFIPSRRLISFLSSSTDLPSTFLMYFLDLSSQPFPELGSQRSAATFLPLILMISMRKMRALPPGICHKHRQDDLMHVVWGNAQSTTKWLGFCFIDLRGRSPLAICQVTRNVHLPLVTLNH